LANDPSEVLALTDTRASINEETRTENLSTAYWILSVGTLLRLLFFFPSENTGGDAWARAALTAEWVQHPSLSFFFDAWLPLHFWLMGALALLLHNTVLACRLLSLALGLGSLWVFWRLGRTIFGSTAATLSLLVFSFYTLHIAYSTTSSSEAPYLFFVLGGLLCFFIYRRGGKQQWIVLSGICLTLGAAIRYEAWVVMFGMALALLGSPWDLFRRGFWRAQRIQALLLFAVTAGAWPAFWMVYEWIKLGQPFYFIAQNHVWVSEQLAFAQRSLLYRLALTPGVILLTLTPVALAGSFYGLWLTLREQVRRDFAVVLVTVAFVQFSQIISGGVMAFARYTLTLGTLLAAVSGYGLEQLARRYFPQSAGAVRTALATLLVLNLGLILVLSETRHRYSEKFGSISPRLRFTHYIKDVGDYLRPRLAPNDAVVIDDFNVESGLVALAAGLPLQPGPNAFLGTTRKGSELLDFMKAKKPRYLVYADRGTLRPHLSMPSPCTSAAQFAGMEFRCVFENEVYCVYEVRYP